MTDYGRQEYGDVVLPHTVPAIGLKSAGKPDPEVSVHLVLASVLNEPD